MRVRVVTSDGVELDASILDVLMWQDEFTKEISFAASFTEVAALFFRNDKLHCSEIGDGIECTRRWKRFKVKRSGEDEVTVVIEATLNQLLSLLIHELFEKIYWTQNDVENVSRGVLELRKKVEKLGKIVKRLVWRGMR